jgi:hypothetical protein
VYESVSAVLSIILFLIQYSSMFSKTTSNSWGYNRTAQHPPRKWELDTICNGCCQSFQGHLGRQGKIICRVH